MINRKNIASVLLLLAIAFAAVQLIRAAPPNPGHDWAAIGDDPNDVLNAGRGGTGTSTLAADSVLSGNGANPVKFVAPGTSGNVLTSDGTTWQSSAAPSVVSNAVVLLYSDETDTGVFNNSTSENNMRNWAINIPVNTYSYYILEAVVNANHNSNNANRNVTFTWRFKEGANVRKTFTWRSLAWNTATGARVGDRYSATLKTIINNSLPANANLIISGQMSIANAGLRMIVHSFRVYGVK